MSNIGRKSITTLRHAFLSVCTTSETRSCREKYPVRRSFIPSHFAHHTGDFRYEEININLVEKPEWYLKRNPPGQVPALEWIDENSKETRFIPESLVVSDFLDEKYPESRLQPADPYQRAQQRVLVERFSGVSEASFQSLHLSLLSGCFSFLQNFPR